MARKILLTCCYSIDLWNLCQAFFGRWPLVLDFQSGEVCRPTGKPLPMLLSICDLTKLEGQKSEAPQCDQSYSETFYWDDLVYVIYTVLLSLCPEVNKIRHQRCEVLPSRPCLPCCRHRNFELGLCPWRPWRNSLEGLWKPTEDSVRDWDIWNPRHPKQLLFVTARATCQCRSCHFQMHWACNWTQEDSAEQHIAYWSAGGDHSTVTWQEFLS